MQKLALACLLSLASFSTFAAPHYYGDQGKRVLTPKNDKAPQNIVNFCYALSQIAYDTVVNYQYGLDIADMQKSAGVDDQEDQLEILIYQVMESAQFWKWNPNEYSQRVIDWCVNNSVEIENETK